MPRPVKQRYVSTSPVASIFKPRGIPVSALTLTALTLDELEALRLADLEGNSQEEGAAKMNVSRPTFGRIVERARRIVADAIVNGKGLEISGGQVVRARRAHVRCRHCRRPWEVPAPVAGSYRCPHCRE